MISTGLDVCVREQFRRFRGMRVGVIVNPTSVDAQLRHLIDLMHAADNVTVGAIFGPEHGVRGEAQYMEAVDSVASDAATGLPMYSLYGSTFESLTPKTQWLDGLDALVFDIQDVGSRYYTYVYTMTLAMKAAAAKGIAFYVLDRPNPIGLQTVEGNLQEAGFLSFVGLYPMTNRHGMTAGELAQMVNLTEGIHCALTVVPCEGLTRGMSWAQTQRHFISPSPNMPTMDTALVYPGMCLGEGTNVSEGRGTCRPFEQFGAPWLKGMTVAQHLNSLSLPGVVFRSCAFTPTFDKHRGVSCEGAFLHVTDGAIFKPFLTGVSVFQTCFEQGGKHFGWRADAYEFVEDVPAFDLLCGNKEVRLGIESGRALEVVKAQCARDEVRFLHQRAPFLLYPHS